MNNFFRGRSQDRESRKMNLMTTRKILFKINFEPLQGGEEKFIQIQRSHTHAQYNF